MSEIKVTGVPCFDFRDKDGNCAKVTAIIVPIKIITAGPETRIVYACNHHRYCNNKECEYSYASER
jgi:hypothetical protein